MCNLNLPPHTQWGEGGAQRRVGSIRVATPHPSAFGVHPPRAFARRGRKGVRDA